MRSVRIIGIGSDNGDDRIGWDALDALQRSGFLKQYPREQVTLHYCSSPSTLITLMARSECAIVIDAMRSGVLPGTVRLITLNEMQLGASTFSSHSFGAAESVALARILDMVPATTIMYGIEVEQCDASRGASARVRQAIPLLVRRLARELRRLTRTSATTP